MRVARMRAQRGEREGVGVVASPGVAGLHIRGAAPPLPAGATRPACLFGALRAAHCGGTAEQGRVCF